MEGKLYSIVMKINLDKKQIRKFGLGLAVILTVFATLNLYKENHTTALILIVVGVFTAAFALLCPTILKPVYIVFMKVSHVLGWINTRILLGIIFYFAITPVGIIMKIFGKDLLHRKIEPDRQSYWISTEKVTDKKSRYEKQY